MTKLEEEIKKAIQKAWDEYDSETASELYEHLEAKAAAEVAKRYIEKVWKFKEESSLSGNPEIAFKTLDQWFKENGVV
jgi:phosphoglucomutase